MYSRLVSSSRTAVIGLVAVTGVTGAAFAGPIEDRQANMKNVDKAIGALAAIAKKEAPFDAAVVNTNATSLADNVKQAKAHFPDGSATGDKETWAKAEIWQNKTDFDGKADKAVEAAMQMASVTAEADFGAALGALGATCKACHTDYRRPKQ
jgi:cytochrome c556